MKRFLIKSDKFSGTAEIIYNDQGVLCYIDLRECKMTDETIVHFKRALPVNMAGLEKAFSEGTTIVDSDITVTFEMFWKDYPLHRNRFKAVGVFSKMDAPGRVTAYYSLPGYKKYLKRLGWQSAMIADRYLKEKHYETDWNSL